MIRPSFASSASVTSFRELASIIGVISRATSRENSTATVRPNCLKDCPHDHGHNTDRCEQRDDGKADANLAYCLLICLIGGFADVDMADDIGWDNAAILVLALSRAVRSLAPGGAKKIIWYNGLFIEHRYG